MYQFGIIAIPIFLGLLINIHKCTQKIKISQNDNFRYLFIVSFSYAAGQLLISSSYLTSNSFGIFIGFMIYIIHIHVSQKILLNNEMKVNSEFKKNFISGKEFINEICINRLRSHFTESH